MSVTGESDVLAMPKPLLAEMFWQRAGRRCVGISNAAIFEVESVVREYARCLLKGAFDRNPRLVPVQETYQSMASSF